MEFHISNYSPLSLLSRILGGTYFANSGICQILPSKTFIKKSVRNDIRQSGALINPAFLRLKSYFSVNCSLWMCSLDSS